MPFNYPIWASIVGKTSAITKKGVFNLTTGQIAGDGLYTFTSFTFTNASVTGRFGPSLANCLSAYDTGTNAWLNNTSFFNVITTGYQRWTVPKTGTYQITAIGAAGGWGSQTRGAGTRMIGSFSLNQNEQLNIIVGQMGGDGAPGCGGSNKGGGGGGSFVVRTDGTALIVAGGGGGGSVLYLGTNVNANITEGGNQGADTGGAGGTFGSGGGIITTQCVGHGGAGGGFSSNGGAGSDSGTAGAGLSYGNGLNGGTGGNQYGGTIAAGGFGGGGGSSTYMGGGGGGYSGGGSGGVGSCACAGLGAGGGGGSFNAGTNQSNTANHNTTSHGSVLIEFIG